MRLNTYEYFFGQLGSDDCCCCCCCSDTNTNFVVIPNYSYSENYNVTTGDGKYTGTDLAGLFIHSDPYRDQQNDSNAVSFVGTFKLDLTFKDFYYLYPPSTATLTGLGKIDFSEDGVEHRGVIYDVSAKYKF
jgi:hypothetical protein